MSARRTSYARAVGGFDPKFRDALAEDIMSAIARASVVSDAPIMAIRTGETAEALITCLIATCSLSPHFDTPSRLRRFADDLAKRVRRTVAQNRADPPADAEMFFGFRKEGNA